jgi:hypothetical protein
VFNRGSLPFSFRAQPREDWLVVSPREGQVELETRVEVSVDWSRVPFGSHRGELTLEWPGGGRLVVAVPVFNPESPRPTEVRGFIESDGYVSIEAAHYERAVAAAGIEWQSIPELARGSSALTTVPVTAPPSELGADTPRLEYALHLFSTGPRTLTLHVSPTLDCLPGRRLRCGVSLGDEAPQVVDLLADDSPAAWARAVSDGVRKVSVSLDVAQAGPHVLKLWRVDPAVVLQKLVLHGAELRPSYLGPPESPRGPLAEPVAAPPAEPE